MEENFDINKKLECLIEKIEGIQLQIDDLKKERPVNETLDLNIKNTRDKNSSVILESSIIKYTKAAKVIANVIEILADALVVIVKGGNDSSGISLTTSNEKKSASLSGKKLDISGILKSTESLISSLTNSLSK